ncbi:MAG: hypothetical protein WBC65_03180, partial [Ignavibacteria bacterium]
VTFETITFIPKQIMSWQSKPKYADEVCSGVYIKITDRKVAEPYKVAVAILVLLNKYFSQFPINSNNFIDKLAGTDTLRNMIISGRSYEDIISSYQNDLNKFKTVRKKYLLY